MRFAEAMAVRNLSGIGEFTLLQHVYPCSGAGQRPDEFVIDSTWPRPGIARNDYLLARARTGRRKSKPDGPRALVLGVAVDESTGVIDCVALKRDFNSVVAHDDPINHGSDQFADFYTPRSARHVATLIVATLSAA